MPKVVHTGIIVKNMDESLKFYIGVLGFTTLSSHELPHAKLAFLEGIELLEYPNDTTERKEGMINHIAIEVEDMESAINHLKEQGVALTTDVPRNAMGGMKIFHFEGPNGERIEFVQQPK